MIVIAGHLSLKADKTESAAVALAELVSATRAESGCIEYAMGFDLVDPTLVRIFEVWESDDALANHAGSSHVDQWRKEAPSMMAGPISLMRYVVESAGSYP